MARKPTPHNLKVIAGTDRPDRAPPKDMPEFDSVSVMPQPPQHLNPDGREMWFDIGGKLVDAKVLQSVDLYALEQLCVRWQSHRQLAKASIAATAADDNALKALFSEFGLTPASRRKVGVNDTNGRQDNAFKQRGAANRSA